MQMSEPIKQTYVNLLFAAWCHAIDLRDGKGAVAMLDALTVQIGRDEVDALMAELLKVGLRRLSNIPASRQPTCGMPSTVQKGHHP